MTTTFSDGHIQSQDERDRDAATVMAIVAQMPHDALVPFTPDDARASRIEREDDEAMWDARLAAGPDVADDSDATGASYGPCTDCGRPAEGLDDNGRIELCHACHEQRRVDRLCVERD